MLSCKSLRAGILSSAALLLAGFAVEFLAVNGLMPTVLGSYLGLFMATGSVVVLLGLFVLSLFPTVARRLAECEH